MPLLLPALPEAHARQRVEAQPLRLGAAPVAEGFFGGRGQAVAGHAVRPQAGGAVDPRHGRGARRWLLVDRDRLEAGLA
jgi:hypothetical protein